MVRYRRNFVPRGTYFFTVTLADRTSSALVHHVGALRMAFRIARHERPFTNEAIVILPEHLHAIWTLPSGDSDFPGRCPALDYVRGGSFPVSLPVPSDLSRKIVKIAQGVPLSRVFPDRIIRPGTDEIPYRELVQRVARVKRSETRGSLSIVPGLRCAPPGLQSSETQVTGERQPP